MMGHGMWGGCCSGIFSGLGMVGSILNLVLSAGLIIGIVVLIIWAIRRFSSSQNTVLNRSTQQDIMQSPLEILKSRYAGGKITREEFMDMKEDLK